MAEAGAIAWETSAFKSLFGIDRPTNGNYLAAIKERLAGGNFADCFNAFFQNLRTSSPDEPPSELAHTAFNRTMRIFRGSGAYGIDALKSHEPHVFNSKTLVYIEQEILAQQLRGTIHEKYLMLAGINLQTLAELHEFGLFDPDSITAPHIKPHEIIMPRILELIENYQQSLNQNSSN